MRKTTAYARRRARQGLPTDPSVGRLTDYAHWSNAITHRRTYESDPINAEHAAKLMVNVRMAYQKLCDHTLPPDDYAAHDDLAHAIGVSQIRVKQIGGAGANDVMLQLNAASAALERTLNRWKSTKSWGLDGLARRELLEAIEIHEAILLNSTPMQMHKAWKLRLARLDKRQRAEAKQSKYEPA